MLKWILPAVTLMGLTGCGYKNSSYVVLIDPKFSPEEIKAIDVGLRDWHRAIPELTFRERIDRCDGRANGYICFHYSTLEEVHRLSGRQDYAALTDPSNEHPEDWAQNIDGAQIYMGMDLLRTSDHFRVVAEHEVGHGWGAHHIGPGNIMAHDATSKDQWATPDDAAQFYEERGLPRPTPPVPSLQAP